MEENEKRNSNSGVIIAISSAVIIAAIAVIVVVVFLSKDKKSEPSTSNPESSASNTGSNTNNINTLSESEAIAIAKEKYEKIHGYYLMMGDPKDTVTPNANENWYERIDNYDEITSNLTNNALQQLTDKRKIIKENGKYYIQTFARGTDITYYGNDGFEVKNITEDRIEFTVKEKYCANMDDVGKEESEITDFEYKNNPFVLVKENGNWKVDEFTLPN